MIGPLAFCAVFLCLFSVVRPQNIVFPKRSRCDPSEFCIRKSSCNRDIRSLKSCGQYRVCCPDERWSLPPPEQEPPRPGPWYSPPRRGSDPSSSASRPRPWNSASPPRPGTWNSDSPPRPESDLSVSASRPRPWNSDSPTRPGPWNSASPPRPGSWNSASPPRPGPGLSASPPRPGPGLSASPPRPGPRKSASPPRPGPGLSASPPISTNQECGVSKSSKTFRGLVMGGTNVTQGTYPWMAAVLEKENGIEDIVCTSFLIDMRHALSAAHCFPIKDPSQYALRIGDVEWRKGTRYEVERIDIPKGYKRKRYYDDIAVITLKQLVTDDIVVPVCLPDEELLKKDLTAYGVTVAGWGKDKYGGEMSEQLMQLKGIPVIPNEDCHKMFSPHVAGYKKMFNRQITKEMICAGFLQGGKGSCQGDSGGPIMIKHNHRMHAVGIVSFGIKCGTPGFPSGYTRVSEYMDYIRKHTS